MNSKRPSIHDCIHMKLIKFVVSSFPAERKEYTASGSPFGHDDDSYVLWTFFQCYTSVN